MFNLAKIVSLIIENDSEFRVVGKDDVISMLITDKITGNIFNADGSEYMDAAAFSKHFSTVKGYDESVFSMLQRKLMQWEAFDINYEDDTKQSTLPDVSQIFKEHDVHVDDQQQEAIHAVLQSSGDNRDDLISQLIDATYTLNAADSPFSPFPPSILQIVLHRYFKKEDLNTVNFGKMVSLIMANDSEFETMDKAAIEFMITSEEIAGDIFTKKGMNAAKFAVLFQDVNGYKKMAMMAIWKCLKQWNPLKITPLRVSKTVDNDDNDDDDTKQSESTVGNVSTAPTGPVEPNASVPAISTQPTQQTLSDTPSVLQPSTTTAVPLATAVPDDIPDDSKQPENSGEDDDDDDVKEFESNGASESDLTKWNVQKQSEYQRLSRLFAFSDIDVDVLESLQLWKAMNSLTDDRDLLISQLIDACYNLNDDNSTFSKFSKDILQIVLHRYFKKEDLNTVNFGKMVSLIMDNDSKFENMDKEAVQTIITLQQITGDVFTKKGMNVAKFAKMFKNVNGYKKSKMMVIWKTLYQWEPIDISNEEQESKERELAVDEDPIKVFYRLVVRCSKDGSVPMLIQRMMEKILQGNCGGKIIAERSSDAAALKEFLMVTLESQDEHFLDFLTAQIIKELAVRRTVFETQSAAEFSEYVLAQHHLFPAEMFRNNGYDTTVYASKTKKELIQFLSTHCGYSASIARQLLERISMSFSDEPYDDDSPLPFTECPHSNRIKNVLYRFQQILETPPSELQSAYLTVNKRPKRVSFQNHLHPDSGREPLDDSAVEMAIENLYDSFGDEFEVELMDSFHFIQEAHSVDEDPVKMKEFYDFLTNNGLTQFRASNRMSVRRQTQRRVAPDSTTNYRVQLLCRIHCYFLNSPVSRHDTGSKRQRSRFEDVTSSKFFEGDGNRAAFHESVCEFGLVGWFHVCLVVGGSL